MIFEGENMNLVDLLKQQIGGEVAKTLGGMVNASESDVSKVLGPALPGLLSGLGALASTKEGAGKIASAVGGLDSSLLGNLAGMLGGSVAKQGSSMLGSLFSGVAIDGLASAISKFTGISPSIIKPLLGYLTPMVLGGVGKSLAGGKIDASGISRLFADQKSSIASAMPSGFSLAGIQGLADLGSAASGGRPAPAAPEGGLGKLLWPALALAALLGLFLYWNSVQKPVKEMVQEGGAAAGALVESAKEQAAKVEASAQEAVADAGKAVADAAKAAVDKVGDLAKVDVSALTKDFSGMFDGLGEKLGKLSDAAGAEAFLPELKKYSEQLDGYGKTISALPAESKSIFTDLIQSQLKKLGPIFEKLTGFQGIGDEFVKLIGEIKDKLAKLMA